MNYVKYKDNKIYPTKIICAALNYVDHAKELELHIAQDPVIFIKPNSAISETLESQNYNGYHYEAELAFLVINSNIYSVGFGLDITKRDLQNNLIINSQPWERSKAFDKSAVFTDFVDFSGNINNLSFNLMINGKLVQSSNASSMIHTPNELLEFITKEITLCDGDILMTGTPSGIGNFSTGDHFTCQIFDEDRPLISHNFIATDYK